MATAPREAHRTGSPVHWLCTADDPWVRYRARTQLLSLPETDAAVVSDRQAMLTHPKLRQLIAAAATWPGGVLKRHNDARHVLHQLAVLADLGIRADDPGMKPVIRAILEHQSIAGAFQSLILAPRAFGGTDEPTPPALEADLGWVWLVALPGLLVAWLARRRRGFDAREH